VFVQDRPPNPGLAKLGFMFLKGSKRLLTGPETFPPRRPHAQYFGPLQRRPPEGYPQGLTWSGTDPSLLRAIHPRQAAGPSRCGRHAVALPAGRS